MSNNPFPEQLPETPIISKEEAFERLKDIADKKGVVKYRYNNSYHDEKTINEIPWTYARVSFEGDSIGFYNQLTANRTPSIVRCTKEKFTGYPDDRIPSLTKWVEVATVTEEEIKGIEFSYPPII